MLGVDVRVRSIIEILRLQRVCLQIPVWTSEQMPMIDEMRLKPLARSFREDCLPMISVIGADIEEPSSPKIDAIPDAMEKCARKNLQQSSMLCPQESRTKAQAHFRDFKFGRNFHQTG
jgi:hypothetical protein